MFYYILVILGAIILRYLKEDGFFESKCLVFMNFVSS